MHSPIPSRARLRCALTIIPTVFLSLGCDSPKPPALPLQASAQLTLDQAMTSSDGAIQGSGELVLSFFSTEPLQIDECGKNWSIVRTSQRSESGVSAESKTPDFLVNAFPATIEPGTMFTVKGPMVGNFKPGRREIILDLKTKSGWSKLTVPFQVARAEQPPKTGSP